MKKKKNVIKRNSGFILFCILAGGVTFAFADKALSDGMKTFLATEAETETCTEAAVLEITEEPETDRIFETDAFAVYAGGTVEVVELQQEEEAQDTASTEEEGMETQEIDELAEGETEKPELGYVDFWADSILPQTAVELIDNATLDVFNEKEIRLIRCEILARHGRMFDDQDLQEYFGGKYWYVPYYTPEEFDARMNSLLTEYELKNLEFIRAYEAARFGSQEAQS